MESIWKTLRSVLGLLLLVLAVMLFFTPLSRFTRFWEAPIRSKHSRVRWDQRVVAQALETYWNEHSSWPARSSAAEAPPRFENLAEQFQATDPFRDGKPMVGYFEGDGFLLLSAGPDEDFDIHAPWELYAPGDSAKHLALLAGPWTYDSTNGTVSDGDVWRMREEAP